MTGYEPPIVNQVAYAFGMAAVMFWPVWLVAFLVGALSFVRRHHLSGGTLLLASVIPVVIFSVFIVLIQMEVDIGPRDGFGARALDATFWPYLASTGVCLLGVVLIAIRTLLSWAVTRRRQAHA